MEKRKPNDLSPDQCLAVDTESLCKLLDCGRHTAVQIGDLAHARITMNSRVLWSVQRVKEYLYEISCSTTHKTSGGISLCQKLEKTTKAATCGQEKHNAQMAAICSSISWELRKSTFMIPIWRPFAQKKSKLRKMLMMVSVHRKQ